MGSKQKEMAGGYEVIQSLRIGGKTLLIGYNPDDKDGKYMTCYRESSFMGEFFTRAMASNDYLEIARLFTERSQEQIKSVEQFRAQSAASRWKRSARSIAASAARARTLPVS